MKNEEIVDLVIKNLLEIELKEYKIKNESFFTGINSNIESIDIVSSIGFIEDELEKNNIILTDLFEIIFENEELTFHKLRNLILENINK